jgi:DNA-binding NarL/FixJ family response regulator
MSSATVWAYATHDAGLYSHWHKALPRNNPPTASSFDELSTMALPDGAIVWLDLALPDLPDWQSPSWQALLQRKHYKVVATSSNPKDAEGIAALDAGCVGYCHAFTDAGTLRQISKVVLAGNFWIGPALMQRLIRSANQAAPLAPISPPDWSITLTQREKQVATLAAKGASNSDIAATCSISERTVKAHLSAAFDKLGVADRLQLALKVHGIQ